MSSEERPPGSPPADDTPDAGVPASGLGDPNAFLEGYRPELFNRIEFGGETLASVVGRKLRKVARNITLEPVMLFLSIVCKSILSPEMGF